MKIHLNKSENLLSLSILFTLLLLVARITYSGNTAYLFYPWNLFLAVVPIFFSRKLAGHCTASGKSLALIAGWLLFFPNAPYIITDIFHFYKRPGIPLWYDLILVLSAAWNGLVAGFISLTQVDAFITRHAGKNVRHILTAAFMCAASVGIYIGRFLRLNSWDVVTQPRKLGRFAVEYVFKPLEHVNAWAFSLLCTAFLLIVYYTIKNLSAVLASA